MTANLTRPRLLARAAAAGASLYRRERDLKTLLPSLFGARTQARVIGAIGAAEASCEAERKHGAPTYSLGRHIALLAALMAETRRSPTAA